MKKIIILFSILFLGISLGFYIFLKKNYLDFEIVSNRINTNEPFYPEAYRFFHSKESYNNFFTINSNTENLKSNFPNTDKLDFDNYSYCIFFGKEVNSLFYSYKTTYFNDPSPSYASARRHGKQCVFVTYKNQELEKNGIFLYRIKKDEKLTGFDGL